MKNYIILFVIIILCFSCKYQEKEESRNISLGDTITTESGLKYIFLKEGHGNAIELNSKVYAYMDLYLNDSDSLFWSTATEKDSTLGFIHGKTSMIKGFEELNNYLVEGDEVIAILPDSLAYGKEGGNGMPPAATLIYNPLIIKQVSKPKKGINDTLQHIVTNHGTAAGIRFYEALSTSELKNEFHTEISLIYKLLDSLSIKKQYPEALELSLYFINASTDESELENLTYYQTFALENQGKIKEAITAVEAQLQRKGRIEWWTEKKKNLEKKLDSVLGN